MDNLHLYIYLTFGVTVIAGGWIFAKATGYSKLFLVLVSAWILLQSVLGAAGFYSHDATMAKRFPLLLLPPLVLLLACFVFAKGRAFIDGLNIRALTLFHLIRLPVEIVLFWLFVGKTIPVAMTFEGRNFDIFAGLTAPIIYYYGMVKGKLHRSLMIIWNIICVGLLFNVAINAILSLPGRSAKFGFEVPNIALGYFPFVLLPACLVPLALFSNLASVRILAKGKAIGS